MNNEIYCVKLQQRRLSSASGLDYFPFDRFYIVPRENKTIGRELFRYCFELEVNASMLKAINAIPIDKTRTITLHRDDKKKEYKDLRGVPNFFYDDNGNPQLHAGAWRIVVPTHVRTRKVTRPEDKVKQDKKVRETFVSYIGYVLSRILTADSHNNKSMLPAITLHTPNKSTPLICAMCSGITKFYAGDCTPGRVSCSSNADIEMTQDTYYRETEKEGEEWA